VIAEHFLLRGIAKVHMIYLRSIAKLLDLKILTEYWDTCHEISDSAKVNNPVSGSGGGVVP